MTGRPRTLSIRDLGARGDGIADMDGSTVFVPGTLAGETVEAEIEGQRGALVSVIDASPDRIMPFCPHFGHCGGCQLQHMAPGAYGSWKCGLARDALARAGLAPEIAEPIIAHGIGRRRATLHATPKAAGFMALRSHEIAAIERCPILVPSLARAPEIARAVAGVVGPCDVTLTASALGLDVLVKCRKPRGRQLLAPLAARFDLARLCLNGEIVAQARTPLVEIDGIHVPLPPGAFLQATGEAETILAELVLAHAAGARNVADLFCGIGPFALRLARQSRVFAADTDAPAIAALLEGYRLSSGLKPVTAVRRDLFREPLTVPELDAYDAVVLDPPRAGARPQVEQLAASRVRRVISVSCDPNSFARDAAILVAAGFAMGSVKPVDQFAHSSHLELVALFTRK
ncbi:class I SAM-dependent RNA methyltransferase [Pelagibacterium montanilacus]|uniref:class I SAM-dependent RNA methyltransferase n=1 Tax=Pelagibacterium montanilacus TaxID=2185280 RepID=UPI000F8E7239|nr:TRAM domain-containing protein [Pelagibacterium montanilacus]